MGGPNFSGQRCNASYKAFAPFYGVPSNWGAVELSRVLAQDSPSGLCRLSAGFPPDPAASHPQSAVMVGG
jgi:hypothetical protein